MGRHGSKRAAMCWPWGTALSICWRLTDTSSAGGQCTNGVRHYAFVRVCDYGYSIRPSRHVEFGMESAITSGHHVRWSTRRAVRGSEARPWTCHVPPEQLPSPSSVEQALKDVVIVTRPLMASPSDPLQRFRLLLRKLLLEVRLQLRHVRERFVAFEARQGRFEQRF